MRSEMDLKVGFGSNYTDPISVRFFSSLTALLNSRQGYIRVDGSERSKQMKQTGNRDDESDEGIFGVESDARQYEPLDSMCEL
jgi:hypothetical protein